MKIPDNISILGHQIKITKHQTLIYPAKIVNMGLTYFVSDKIKLANYGHGQKMSVDNVAESFLHEIIHHLSEKLNIKLTEKQVTVLASGLFQVLKDNKLRF